MAKTKAQRAAEEARDFKGGQDAGTDLLWRLKCKGVTSNDAISAAAWAFSHFTARSDAFMRGIQDALGLKWEEQPMGGWSLKRKGE